jgi:hypothetical protein
MINVTANQTPMQAAYGVEYYFISKFATWDILGILVTICNLFACQSGITPAVTFLTKLARMYVCTLFTEPGVQCSLYAHSYLNIIGVPTCQK